MDRRKWNIKVQATLFNQVPQKEHHRQNVQTKYNKLYYIISNITNHRRTILILKARGIVISSRNKHPSNNKTCSCFLIIDFQSL